MANHRRYTQLHEPIKNTKPIHAVSAKRGKPKITTEAENEASQSARRAVVSPLVSAGKRVRERKPRMMFFSLTCYWLEKVSNKNEFVPYSPAYHRENT